MIRRKKTSNNLPGFWLGQENYEFTYKTLIFFIFKSPLSFQVLQLLLHAIEELLALTKFLLIVLWQNNLAFRLHW